MREGKFLEINKKPTNYFIEKDKEVSGKEFTGAIKDYEKIIESKSGEINEWLNENVLELSPERERVITDVLEAAREVIGRYTGREVHIKRSQIAIVPRGTLEVKDQELFHELSGNAFLHLQRVVVEVAEYESNSEIADKVFHELIHLGSLYRVRYGAKDDDPVLGHYHAERAGLSILHRDGNTKFFHGLEEALTERLSLQYIQSQRENPLYANDFRLGKEMYEEELEEGILTYRKNDAGEVVPMISRSYRHEIESTTRYVQDLYEANTDRFKNVDDVWEVFFQAKFTGRPLKLARLIDKAGGKGEFRRLGEISNNLQ